MLRFSKLIILNILEVWLNAFLHKELHKILPPLELLFIFVAPIKWFQLLDTPIIGKLLET